MQSVLPQETATPTITPSPTSMRTPTVTPTNTVTPYPTVEDLNPLIFHPGDRGEFAIVDSLGKIYITTRTRLRQGVPVYNPAIVISKKDGKWTLWLPQKVESYKNTRPNGVKFHIDGNGDSSINVSWSNGSYYVPVIKTYTLKEVEKELKDYQWEQVLDFVERVENNGICYPRDTTVGRTNHLDFGLAAECPGYKAPTPTPTVTATPTGNKVVLPTIVAQKPVKFAAGDKDEFLIFDKHGNFYIAKGSRMLEGISLDAARVIGTQHEGEWTFWLPLDLTDWESSKGLRLASEGGMVVSWATGGKWEVLAAEYTWTEVQGKITAREKDRFNQFFAMLTNGQVCYPKTNGTGTSLDFGLAAKCP